MLFDILSQPTAPFRESHVIKKLKEILKKNNVLFFQDPIGNLILGVSSQKEYLKKIRQKTDEPLRVYIAHMDHPGFHGVRWASPTELEVQWHGGAPTQKLTDASVWTTTSTGQVLHGKLIQSQLVESGRTIDRGTIQFSNSTYEKETPATQIFGGFSFRAPVWKEGDLIYTKAADDLVGAFAIVNLAIENKKKKNAPFLGLLTRAEEVGFIGAIGHFELKWLQSAKRPVLCISLETSRTLPGAEIGKGPVVRLGDRYTVFNPGALSVFSTLAEKTLPGAYQKRIMDGGSCEATAATVYGFTAIGISVPLGNYHNQSFEGGPDSAHPMGPAPEFVHTQDIAGLMKLCQALLKPGLKWKAPWDEKRKEFKKSLIKYRPLLK